MGRITRFLASLTVIAALAALTAGPAPAQTVSLTTVLVSLRTSGPVPTGVAGFRADVTCDNPVGGTGPITINSNFGVFGGTAALRFPLQTLAAGGSSCRLRVTPVGTANLNVSFPDMSLGTANLAPLTTTLGEVTPGVYSYTSPTVVLNATTIAASSPAFAVSFAYPQLVVRKQVRGDEQQPGAAYPMEIVCTRANGTQVAPVSSISATSFNGTFSLKKDETKTFGLPEFPLLTIADVCSVREIDSFGANGTYSSSRTPGLDGVRPPPLDGVFSGGDYRSAATTVDGQVITVTNSFTGDLSISKVVTGPPGSNIAIYELLLTCDKGGPVERFLLKDRQTKIYEDLLAGMICVVSEPRSDGAQVSYTDNSGTPTDASITIVLTPTSCKDARLSASPDCRANVIVTNSYAAVTTVVPTVAAVPTAAPVLAPAAVTTAAPEVVAAPATPVLEEPTFTG